MKRRSLLKMLIGLPLIYRCGSNNNPVSAVDSNSQDNPVQVGNSNRINDSETLHDHENSGHKISRVVIASMKQDFTKLIGGNSQTALTWTPTYSMGDGIMRIYTDCGLDGIGSHWITPSEDNLTQLLGRDPVEFFRPHDRRTFGPLGTNSMALWDLLGKIYNKPVYELLGGSKSNLVPVYDTSIYFSDQVPQYAQNYKDRFKEEIDMGLALGHRHFKVKVGRGYQWMETEEGYDRDLEVLRTMCDHGGADIMISVDANNGYDLSRAKKFVSDTADLNLSFVEELFPENIRDCLELGKLIADNGWDTLVADGELIKNPDEMKLYIDSKSFDIYQGDMRQFGIEGILTEADWVYKQGRVIAPHNWGSILGYIESLHVGAALPNCYAAEHNPLIADLISTESYEIHNGMVNVPELPGFGLEINEEVFSDIEVIFDTGVSTGV